MMQISHSKIFCFVEGFSDRYIYSRITDAACNPKSIKYEIITAEELPEEAGGKASVLAFYDYAKRSDLLDNDFQGKRTVSLFFLDKDVDDVLRRKRRSRHVIYTESYDIEGSLFENSDLSQAAANAACLDIKTCQSLGSNVQWCRKAAQAWLEWVKICLTACYYSPAAGPYYSRPISQINTTPFAEVNVTDVAKHKLRLKLSSELSSAEFSKASQKIEQLVSKLYNKGEFGKVFRGKWYPVLLLADIEKAAAGRRYNSSNFADRIICCLAERADYEGRWTLRYRETISLFI